MAKPVIHFAHANGFPARTYAQLFHFLEDQYQVRYLDMHGHNPRYPVTDNWDELALELIDELKANDQGPVIGVGHSLGGVLILIAAVRQPQLFQQIVLLDAPVLEFFRAFGLRVAKYFKVAAKLTPGANSRLRRTTWADRDQAYAYFRHKTLFKCFTDACLRDYVEYGLEPCPAGVRLRFDRAIEYQIYSTLPHNLSRYHGQLKLPATLLYGAKSHVVNASCLRMMRKHFNMQVRKVPGEHLFPFEYPEITAKVLQEVIAANR